MAVYADGSYVSTITSCEIGNSRDVIAGLWRHSEYYLDLYAFHEEDIELLAAACDHPNPQTVTELAAALDPVKAAELIRQWLPAAVRSYCQSPLSPVRALATNFPEISDPDAKKRQRTQEAILNCARLADALGARCVEIVGGPSFNREVQPNGDINTRAGTEIRRQRQTNLVNSLKFLEDKLAEEGLRVGIALEIEPGPAYLLNSISQVNQIFAQPVLRRISRVGFNGHIGLNVDIGHMFILADEGEDPMPKLYEMMPLIVHFHASDHTVSHFCDLEIKSFHTEGDFRRWIDFFFQVSRLTTRHPFFTGTIAIEMEAGHSLDQAVRSARLMRTWVEEAAAVHNQNVHSTLLPPRMQPKLCTIVLVDIVSSTKLFMSIKTSGMLPIILSAFVRQMEQLVNEKGGFFDKFTGDGFMAIFSANNEQESAQHIVWRTLDFVSQIKGVLFTLLNQMLSENSSTDAGFEGLRVGMSLGEIYFGAMNDGPRSQVTAVGAPVVEAARIMAMCESNQVLANEALYKQPKTKKLFIEHSYTELKGLPGKRRIYAFTGIKNT